MYRMLIFFIYPWGAILFSFSPIVFAGYCQIIQQLFVFVGTGLKLDVVLVRFDCFRLLSISDMYIS